MTVEWEWRNIRQSIGKKTKLSLENNFTNTKEVNVNLDYIYNLLKELAVL